MGRPGRCARIALDVGSSDRGQYLGFQPSPAGAQTAHQQEVGKVCLSSAHMYIHCLPCMYTCLHERVCIREWVMNVNRGAGGRTLKGLKRQEESGLMGDQKGCFFLRGERKRMR